MADPTVPVAPLPQAVQAAVIKELTQVLAAIGTVQSLPENLPPPSRPVVLTGTVVTPLPADPSAPPQPQVAVVQTALGPLILTLNTALAPGPVTVQLQPGNPPAATVLIAPPPSQPAAPTVAQTPTQAPVSPNSPHETVQTLPVSLASAPPIAIGQVLQGVLIPAVAAKPADLATAAPATVAPVTLLPAAQYPATASPVEIAEEVPVALSTLPSAALQFSALANAPLPLASLSLQAQESSIPAGSTNAPTPLPAPIQQSFLVTGLSPPAAPVSAIPIPAAVAVQPLTVPMALAPNPASLPVAASAVAPILAALSSPLPSTPAAQTPVAPSPSTPASTILVSTIPIPAAATLPAPVSTFTSPVAVPSMPALSPTLASITPAVPPDPAPSPSISPAANNSSFAPPPPSTATPAALQPAALPPTTISATVIASTASQQPVLAVPNGTIIISQPASIRPGTTLTLQVLRPDQAATPPALTPLGRESWPALQQGLALLAVNPAATAAITRFIPTLGQDFVATLVAYLTKSGGIDKGSDPILRGLKIDAPGLPAVLRQLQADVLGKPIPQPAAQPWQAYPVPFLTGAELSLIQLYVRQQIDPEEAAKDPKKRRRDTTRFLLEVSPSELGPVQLDGFLRKESRPLQPASPHLDLIVRSEATIPPAGAAELQGLFINALESTGLTGRLSFQYGRENFVQPESGVGRQVEVKV